MNLTDKHQQATYPREACIHELFEAQVAQTPQAVAVVFQESSLTYQQLNQRANQVAHRLQSLGAGPEMLIGISVPRSLEMVIGLLGILKAGAAYVPLDLTYPAARLAWMLEDAHIPVWLTQRAELSRLPQVPEVTVICLDDPQDPRADNLVNPSQADNLAYVMYTSGSTGQPKGVNIMHRGVVRLVKNTHYANFSPDEVFLQLAPLAFDASTFEIWGALLNGAKLVIMPPSQPSLKELGHALQRYQITTLWLTASLFHQMVDEQLEDLKHLRQLLAGGEALSVPHVKKALSALTNCTLINGYGPTENTTFTCCYPMHDNPQVGETVPIGRPIANTQVYVLNEQLQQVSTGELYIGGDGLARGYLNRPQLTAEKFIPHPFLPNARLYKTGDLVRYRPDGILEFIGRIDFQIKLRGFRIEPGEIEATIQHFPEVRQALVMAREISPGDKRLVAYVVVTPVGLQQAELTSQLRKFLSEQLPPYMLPAAVVKLAQFPTTARGKIDREALPLPTWKGTLEELPRTATEITLHPLFSQVLNLSDFGIHDDFFELGGHSLLANQLLIRIKEIFKMELPFATLFEAPTVAKLARVLDQSQRSDETLPPLQPVTHLNEFPLSFAQQQLWFEVQLAPHVPIYNEPATLYFQGSINVGVLERSLDELVRRHAALRSHFKNVAGEPLQSVSSTDKLQLSLVDLRKIPIHQRESAALQLATQEAQRPFDLSQDLLIRAMLIILADDNYRLYLVLHHIVFDGISLYSIFLRELATLYQAFAVDQPSPLPEPTLHYPDFAVWQRQWQPVTELAYWKAQLANLTPLQLPTDHPRPRQPTFQGATHTFSFSQELTQALKRLSRQAGVTLYMTLLTTFQILLHRYTGQEDIVVGSVKSLRQRPELAQMCGLFLNTLVLRTDLAGHPTFLQLLQRVRTTLLGAYAHQELPFEQLVAALQPIRQAGVNPLFQVMFTFDPPLAHSNWRLSHFEIHTGTAKFDLTLELDERPTGLLGHFEYRTDLFEPATIVRMTGHLQTLLAGVVANPEQPIAHLPLLTVQEEQQLNAWQQTTSYYPRNSCIHQLFEEQARLTPEAVAVVLAEQTLTYRELNERANQLARHLKALGVQTETLVGLGLPRGLPMIVASLAILKAGGAYVPIDLTYPRERLDFMLADAQITVMITSQSFQSVAQVIDLEQIVLAAYDQDNLENTVTAENLAYVMYTSGSTGQPKGVSVTHRGVVRLVKNTNYAHFSAEEVFLQLAPISFDAATFEIWGALLNGAKLVVMPPHLPSLQELGQALQHYQITTLWLTAGLFQKMVEERLEDLTHLRQLLAGGDVLSVAHVKKFLTHLTNCRLINGYGPTENTTFTCCYLMTAVSQVADTVPIGRPIANTQVYILDSYLQPVPVGVEGEIYIGGDGLARGYWKRPELTNEKFLTTELPHSVRLYKSGDRARYRPDGNIEFKGRLDNQVKIRGFRIELGEIEATLTQMVRTAVVLAKAANEGDKRLVAYVVSEQPVTANELRQFLAGKLPDYMIPSAFVVLEAFPLTSNGKIDYRALPEPAGLENSEVVAPRDELERQLQKLWEEVLGVHPIGVKHNFFELGGHSLLAVRLLARIGKIYGKNLPILTIFQAPTIEQFAQQLRPNCHPLFTIPRRSQDGLLPLSFAQQRLWFLEQLEPGTSLYHIPSLFRIRGTLHLDRLKKALESIVARHEVLRTVFVTVEGQPRQVVTENCWLELSVIEGHHETEITTQLLEEIKRPFDLSKTGMLRASLLRYALDDQVLLLVVHHIAADGWSLSILFRELMTFYQAPASFLPELPIQYADFALWQRQYFTEEPLAAQLNYWKSQLANVPLLNFPTQQPWSAVKSYQGARQTLWLSEKLTKSIKDLAIQEEVTLFMVLLATFSLLLHRYTQQDDLVIGVPIATRQHPELQDLIGIFLNNLAIRMQLPPHESFRKLLKQVRQVTLEAYAHQDLSFEKLVEELNPERNLYRHPLFDVMLNLINTPQTQLELPDLAIEPLEWPPTTSKFLMTLYIDEPANQLHLDLVYRQALLSPASMANFLSQFKYLLEQIVEAPEAPLQTYSLVTPDSPLPDPRAILSEPYYEPVTTLVMAWAKRTPHQVAIRQAGREWTYEELANCAASLAQTLLAFGVKPGEVVAIYGFRSFGVISSMLGVLLSGGVLLTIAHNLPPARRQVMLQVARAKLLLYVDETAPTEASLPLVQVHPHTAQLTSPPVKNSPLPNLSPNDAAYIFFTSGSTGIPKGVLGCQKGLSHFLHWQKHTFTVTPQDRCAQLTNLSFDAVLRDVFLPLTSGATLCLPSLGDELNPAAMFTWLETEQISLLHIVPSLAQAWLIKVPPNISLRYLRRIFFVGEPLREKLIYQWREHFPQMGEMINFYGPTETTLIKCYHRISQEPLPGIQPIGVPLPETQALILADNNRLCGIGEPGEIALRTPFRSLGYLNAPEEQQCRFRSNPFREDNTDVLYYTGDLGRYRPDGSLEILGRFDNQIKIKGIRVELEEIEAFLTRHPAVENAAVWKFPDETDERLIAYVVPKPGQEPTSVELRNFLKQQLPEYLLPSNYLLLEKLPLTSNGKVNRRALPKPEHFEPPSQKILVAPRDALELQVSQIWKSLLPIQDIGIYDNFFDLGGHSLLAITLLDQIEKTLEKGIPMIDFFQSPTIAKIADILRGKSDSQFQQALSIIQSKGTRSPFFFVGSTAYANALAPYLGDNQPMYDLSIFGLQSQLQPLEVPTIAKHYVEEIQGVQPQGPYYLGAYCADAKVAFEMAQQLRMQGQAVAFLAFIDVIWEKQDSYYRHWHNLLKFGPEYLSHKIKNRFKFDLVVIKLALGKWMGKWYQRRKISLSIKLQHILLINEFYEALRSYTPQTYPGKVTLFLSSDWRLQNSQTLSQLAVGGVEVHDISGYHDTLFELPHVEMLGKLLRQCLELASQDHHTKHG